MAKIKEEKCPDCLVLLSSKGKCFKCGYLKDCKHESKKDFSYFESFGDVKKTEHLYCPDCKAHWLKGKKWSAHEWEKWINETE